MTPLAEGPHPRLKIAKNVLHLALGQVATTVLAIISTAVLARTLGPSQFGLYFFVISMAMFGYTIVEWGQPLLLIGEVVARPPNCVGELLGTALALRVLAAPIVLLSLLITASVLGYDTSTKLILSLYFGAALPISLARGFGTVFRGMDRMDRDALVNVLNSAFGLAFVLVALALSSSLITVVLSQFAAGLVSLAGAHYFYRHLSAAPLAVGRGVARHLWKAGAAIVLLSVVQAAQPYFDVLILSKFAPPDVVGWFGAARNIMGTLYTPAGILGAAVLPQLTRSAQVPESFGHELRSALRPMLIVGALGAAGTYLFAQTAVELIYGTHYAPAITILQAFAPVLFLLFVDALIGFALFAANRTKALAKIKVASVVVNILLDAVLIPWFQAHHGNGGIGVVIGFGLSELVVFALTVAILPRGAFLPETIVEIAKSVAAATATVLLLLSIPRLAPAAAIPIAVVAFVTFGIALGLVRASDLALLDKLVRSAWSRP